MNTHDTAPLCAHCVECIHFQITSSHQLVLSALSINRNKIDHAFYLSFCQVKVNLLSYKPANQLSDVLLVIFDQLDEEDLFRCETVGRQWRNVLLSGRP